LLDCFLMAANACVGGACGSALAGPERRVVSDRQPPTLGNQLHSGKRPISSSSPSAERNRQSRLVRVGLLLHIRRNTGTGKWHGTGSGSRAALTSACGRPSPAALLECAGPSSAVKSSGICLRPALPGSSALVNATNRLNRVGVIAVISAFVIDVVMREKGSLMSKVTRSRSEQLRRGRKKRRLFSDLFFEWFWFFSRAPRATELVLRFRRRSRLALNRRGSDEGLGRERHVVTLLSRAAASAARLQRR
jgi:hypothetical protein